jgi:hypothetical protein
MNTLDHDATDDELTAAILEKHIAPALDVINLLPFETPDPKPNELLVIVDRHNNIYARITVDIIRS